MESCFSCDYWRFQIGRIIFYRAGAPSAVWGVNKTKGSDGENAFLLEGSWRKNKLAHHGRYEWVQKSVDELVLGKDIVQLIR